MSSLALTPLAATAFGAVPAEVAASAYALKTDVPTIAELVANSYHNSTITQVQSFPVFVAPFACVIVAARLVTWQSGVANNVTANDTNYWTVDIRRTRAAASVTIASKTTKATGGETITYRVDWNFDAVTFNTTNRVLGAGDIVDFAFTETGTATDIPGPLMQIRYEPS